LAGGSRQKPERRGLSTPLKSGLTHSCCRRWFPGRRPQLRCGREEKNWSHGSDSNRRPAVYETGPKPRKPLKALAESMACGVLFLVALGGNWVVLHPRWHESGHDRCYDTRSRQTTLIRWRLGPCWCWLALAGAASSDGTPPLRQKLGKAMIVLGMCTLEVLGFDG